MEVIRPSKKVHRVSRQGLCPFGVFFFFLCVVVFVLSLHWSTVFSCVSPRRFFSVWSVLTDKRLVTALSSRPERPTSLPGNDPAYLPSQCYRSPAGWRGGNSFTIQNTDSFWHFLFFWYMSDRHRLWYSGCGPQLYYSPVFNLEQTVPIRKPGRGKKLIMWK